MEEVNDYRHRRYRMRFNSWGELMAQIDNATPEQIASSHREANAIVSEEWMGTNTWEEALPLMRSGWEDGAARIARRSVQLTKQLDGVERQPVMRTMGPGRVNVPRYLQSNPRYFRVLRPVPVQSHTIKILVNQFVSAAIGTEAIFRRGEAITAMILGLERNGYRVELWWGLAGQSFGSGLCEILTRVKATNQRINAAMIAYVMAHNSAFRRTLFAVGETMPDWARKEFGCDGGFYFSPGRYSEEIRSEFDIHIDRMGAHDHATFDAEWITAMLENAGIRLGVSR